MKKYLFIFVLLVPMMTWAQTEAVLGYCPADIPESAGLTGIEGSEARVSAAICLPREMLMRYKGGRVTKIRIGVRQGFTSCSVWLRRNLNERSVVVQSVREIANGWNEVVLTKPLEIDGEALYVGYTVQQPADFQGILHSGTGTENTSWLAEDNTWTDYHNFGVGVLFIQAVVEADVKKNDLALITLTAPTLVAEQDETITAQCEVENLGTQTIQGFTVSGILDGVETLSQVFDVNLAPDDVYPFQAVLPNLISGEGEHHLIVRISPKSGSDERVDNDSKESNFFSYGEASIHPRKTLLEHFTSIPCVNCPPVDELLEKTVNDRADVVWVAHHVGYRDDELTLEDSRPLTAFGVIGNPEIMLNRSVIAGNTAAFAISGMTESEVGQLFDVQANIPAFASLRIEPSVNDNLITIKVEGDAAGFFSDLYPNARLHVLLVEDNVKAEVGQAGNPSKLIHDNITRAIPTGVNGTAISWTNSAFVHTLSLETGEWDLQQLRVVAFITLPATRGSNLPSGSVLNVAQASFYPNTGILSFETDVDRDTCKAHDLQGRPIKNTKSAGIYVINGNKILIR